MDSLMRQEKTLTEMPEKNDSEAEEEVTPIPEAPRDNSRGFLDKLTERVKDFLDNAE
jgi:cell division protein FtsA